ncbi:PKD domain-containing protein [Paraglaciecola aquimarina]|uniref:PKD domain-containing protein n=1 Tax=Paraglaciecola aquimarina TaxID=1235557 RepID=A0ABU3SZR5_9ALTE|nr:PKD domain-containing protein [Paraglaciecola aquimarina]MDU0355491.1 PKD domain-containing protein [Paraglaciecola aquimarina]
MFFHIGKKHLSTATATFGLLSLLSGCGGSTEEIVSELTNKKPTVTAVDNFSADEQTTVTLTASATDSDGSIRRYQWTQSSGTSVTLQDPNSNTATFLAPDVTADETLSFDIEVTDNENATSTDTVTITILRVNQQPIAVAGQNVSSEIQQLVTLSGAASSDADGDQLTYSWLFTAPDGSASSLSSVTSSAPEFTPDVAGQYTATLTVNDGYEDSQTSTVTINVTEPAVQTTSRISGKIFTFSTSGSSMLAEPEDVSISVTMLDSTDQVLATSTPEASQIQSIAELRFSTELTGLDPTYISVEVAASGYTSYTRRVDLQENIIVDAKLQEITVSDVTTSSKTSISGANIDGFNFSMPETEAGSLAISIPSSLLPDDTTTLKVAAKSYNPNEPEDAEFFPGEYEDSSGQKLVSVAFDYAEIVTNTGEPVVKAMQRKRNEKIAIRSSNGTGKADEEEPVIINRQIPSASCPIMASLGDSDDSKDGFQVPVYTSNPNTGLWDLLGQGTVYDDSGLMVAATTSSFDCTSSTFTLEIMVTNEIFLSKWWNLDYPLVFEQPTYMCANIVVQNTEQQTLSSTIGFLSDKDDSFDFSSRYFITDKLGQANIKVLKTSNQTDSSAQLYIYNTDSFGYESSDITLSENCDTPELQVVTVDRPQQCQVNGKTEYEEGSPAVNSLIYAIPNSLAYIGYDFALTDEQGEYLLNLTCDTSYTIYDYSAFLFNQGNASNTQKAVIVDNVVDADEQTDDGNSVLMNNFTVGFYEPLLQVIPRSSTDQIYVYAYSTYGAYPLDVSIRFVTEDGSKEFGRMERTLEPTNENSESYWYVTYSFNIFDYEFPDTEGETPYMEIIIVDALGKTWVKERTRAGQF